MNGQDQIQRNCAAIALGCAIWLSSAVAKADPADLANGSVVQVSIPTRDLGKAESFYRDVMGFHLAFETHGMAFFQLRNLQLMVGVVRRGQIEPSDSELYFEAQDWSATESSLIARGLKFSNPTEIVQRANGKELAIHEFTDPDGNRLAIMGWREDSRS